MTRWKKDETEFTVSLFIDKSRGSMCIVPKPIVEKLDNPKKLKFKLSKHGIIVGVGDD